MYDSKLEAEYKEFEKESKRKFIELNYKNYMGGNNFIASSYQPMECNVVKRAKLIISNYYECKGKFVFNEIMCRKNNDFGTPIIDLYDVERRLGIKLHWNHKKIYHSEMVKRILKYKKLFGDCVLVLLSWGEGNGFKPRKGYTYLHEFTNQKYRDAEIKVVFFNVDKPTFKWLGLGG